MGTDQSKQPDIGKYTNRLDNIGGILFLVSVFLNIQHLPWAAQLTIVSLSTLSLSSIFKAMLHQSDEGALTGSLRKAFHFGIACGVVSTLFTIQHWPGAQLTFLLFGSICLLGVIVSVWRGIEFHKLVGFNEKVKFGGALVFYFLAL